VTVPSGLPVLKGLAVLGHHPDGITILVFCASATMVAHQNSVIA